MSNEIALFSNGLPAFLKNVELDEVTKSLIGTGGGGKRISLKGNMFRMISNGEEMAVNEDRAMNIVIVNAAKHTSRTYYKGTYKEGVKASPACWSADGLTPSEKAPDKQAGKCADCPQNIKGSGEGEAKACRYFRELAVVLDGDMEGDVYALTLASQSIFGTSESGKLALEAYARALAAHKSPITAVVTEMRFDTKSPTPKLTFKPVRALTEAEWNICSNQARTPAALKAIEHEFTVIQSEEGEAFETAKPAPKADTPKAAKPKPAPVEEDEDDVPAPVKAKSAKEETPVEDKDLASLLDAWAKD
jgi:hypothetical protein